MMSSILLMNSGAEVLLENPHQLFLQLVEIAAGARK
jgi:hypothetical protein